MKKLTSIHHCLAIGLFAILSPLMVSGQESAQKSEDAEKSAQELAIRATVEQFAKAYNAHDAKAIAELFVAQAQIVDEDDNTIQGRDSIQQLFADVFAEQPESRCGFYTFHRNKSGFGDGFNNHGASRRANSGSGALQRSAYPERWKMVDGNGS
jgi:ketosteroid isomerase-like protein